MVTGKKNQGGDAQADRHLNRASNFVSDFASNCVSNFASNCISNFASNVM